MPDRNHNAAEASRQVGAVDVTPKPTVAPNVTRMNERAVAASAPRIIGDHCKNLGATSPRGATTVLSKDIFLPLSKAKEAQDRQNHHHKPDQINETAHDCLPTKIARDNRTDFAKFLQRGGNVPSLPAVA